MQLRILTDQYIEQFKTDMKAAFRYGAAEGMGEDAEVLPEEDIIQSLNTQGSIAYIALEADQLLGGAIVVVDNETQEGHLHFLYAKVGEQGKGIGQFIWNNIEKLHPEVRVWETITPYFDVRNIHFYVNRCGFHVTEFYNEHRPDPQGNTFEMFRFRKEM